MLGHSFTQDGASSPTRTKERSFSVGLIRYGTGVLFWLNSSSSLAGATLPWVRGSGLLSSNWRPKTELNGGCVFRYLPISVASHVLMGENGPTHTSYWKTNARRRERMRGSISVVVKTMLVFFGWL